MLSSTKSKEALFLLHCTISVFVLLAVTVLNLTMLTTQTVKVLGIRSAPSDERDYWENIIKENPTYRDGYIQLARIDSEVGDKISANKNLEIAKKIDPNSINLLKTELELLSSK